MAMTIEAASARASRAFVRPRFSSIARRSSRTTARKRSDEPVTSRKSCNEKTLACSCPGSEGPGDRETAQVPESARSERAAEVPRTPNRSADQRRKGNGMQRSSASVGSDIPRPRNASAPETRRPARSSPPSARRRHDERAAAREGIEESNERISGVRTRLARASPRNHCIQSRQYSEPPDCRMPTPTNAERAGTATTATAPNLAKSREDERKEPPGFHRCSTLTATTAFKA